MKPYLTPLQINTSARDTVTFNDNSIVRVGADGGSQSIAWVDLHEVAIVTTESGPLTDDIFWVLSDGEGSACAVSGAAAGSRELLARLQELPGFDNEAVIAAMASRGGRFICWQHPAAH